MTDQDQKRERLDRLLRERAAAVADHPLSYNQRSLWFTYCLAPDSSAYNVPFAYRVPPATDAIALRHAFDVLMARHAILRTKYATAVPTQHVHARMSLDFEERDVTDWSEARLHAHLLEQAQCPFDLHRGPVWRVRLLRNAAGGDVLLLVFHHIAYDLWSMMTLLTELTSLYASAKAGTVVALPPVRYQYFDFAHWQSEMLAAEGERLWVYWQDQLAGELPILRLPTDFDRPPVQSYAGATHRHPLPPRLVDALSGLARAEETTLFTVLLAGFQLLLHRHSGQDDVVVGSPVVGRSRAEFEHVLGYFLNALPLRASFSGNPTFRAFLHGARDCVRGALEHRDYPVELLVERLKPPRSAARPVLFQTMFVLN